MIIAILSSIVASSLAASCLNDNFNRTQDVVSLIQISNGLSNGTFKVNTMVGNITFPSNCNFTLEHLKLCFTSTVADDPLIRMYGFNPTWNYGKPLSDSYISYNILKKDYRYSGSVDADQANQEIPLTRTGEEIGGIDFNQVDVFIVFSERWQLEIATGTYSNGWARLNRTNTTQSFSLPGSNKDSQTQQTTQSSASTFFFSWFAAIVAVGILA